MQIEPEESSDIAAALRELRVTAKVVMPTAPPAAAPLVGLHLPSLEFPEDVLAFGTIARALLRLDDHMDSIAAAVAAGERAAPQGWNWQAPQSTAWATSDGPLSTPDRTGWVQPSATPRPPSAPQMQSAAVGVLARRPPSAPEASAPPGSPAAGAAPRLGLKNIPMSLALLVLACASAATVERPTFERVAAVLARVRAEVESGWFTDAAGQPQVRRAPPSASCAFAQRTLACMRLGNARRFKERLPAASGRAEACLVAVIPNQPQTTMLALCPGLNGGRAVAAWLRSWQHYG